MRHRARPCARSGERDALPERIRDATKCIRPSRRWVAVPPPGSSTAPRLPVGPAAVPARDLFRLEAICRGAPEQNWREGFRSDVSYAYTAPSPDRYPWPWYWDSCFAAIVWRRFAARRAQAELESLLASRTKSGFIGHTIFWGQPVDRVRSLFYNVSSRSDPMTWTIQPPLLAWAWRVAVGDPGAVPNDQPSSGLDRAGARIGRRRPPVDPSAGRVRPGRIIEVRLGLGVARRRTARLPVAGGA